MSRSLIQLYALTVCFCTLMCGVIALGVAAYDLVRIATPRFTVTNSYGAWDSNEQFVRVYPVKKDLRAEEIATLREKEERDAISAGRKPGQQVFVWPFFTRATDASVNPIHWRI